MIAAVATNSNQHIFFKVINHEYSTEDDHSYIPTVNEVIFLQHSKQAKKFINDIKIFNWHWLLSIIF